jgi:hypothetical protein
MIDDCLFDATDELDRDAVNGVTEHREGGEEKVECEE